jgi:peptide/nickel transport system substrate-binding protein
VVEAFAEYWRQPPSVKKLIFKLIPDETTRFLALKRGEIDHAYGMRGELAEELRRTPGLTLKAVPNEAMFWLGFPDQWNPKSPWHDQLVRQAVSLALNREGIDKVLSLGNFLLTGGILPRDLEYYWQPPSIPYDQARAKALLAEAGFAEGFYAGDYHSAMTYVT